MGRTHCYYVYILSSKSRAIYTGITNDIYIRIWQHKRGDGSEFTARYKINRLVYYEEFKYVDQAIRREKVIKGWTREKKLALVSSRNPAWEDLSSTWDFRNPYQPFSS